MTFRINTNCCKNAMGTVFLLAAAFFVCSTLISMRSVFADPILDTNATNQSTGRQSPRSSATKRANVSRSTTSRAASTTPTASRATASRTATATRTVSSRGITPTRSTNVSSRGVTSRSQTTSNRTTSANRTVRARTSSTPSRVSATGNVMSAGSRVGSTTTYSYLASKLYTGSYSNIIDSTTGLISADAYSTCLEGYYTCMDEICTARSDTKGRCSCAGRATNFLAAETALEKANEELISLSGQLSLLISTKGKDVSEAFKLTDAEKVMNCVSYKDNVQLGDESDADWYAEHPTWNGNSKQTSGIPYYCSDNSIDGFDLKEINGSGSDILASLKAWADAKDLAKQYTTDDTNSLLNQYTTIAGVVNGLSGITETVDTSSAALDGLANKWGYELFEYAHNNVCGRVLDSCFNGIYEACGTPPSGTDSSGNKIGKCANGASSSCPYNYNSAISVTTSGDGAGEVQLNERGSTGSTTSTSATCFGYSSSSGDPYASLRGPVADARRSIMQKYLLDANAACDTYGTALKNTAQNINYQKIAAEQALRQKRLEFYNEEQETQKSEATAAISNFNECISEIWDCYNENANEDNWTTARIKTYCAQVSNVPHCYETMICNPTQITMSIVDDADTNDCTYNADAGTNTCRNIVTLNEILHGAAVSTTFTTNRTNMQNMLSGVVRSASSQELREACLRMALNCTDDNTSDECLRDWHK